MYVCVRVCARSVHRGNFPRTEFNGLLTQMMSSWASAGLHSVLSTRLSLLVFTRHSSLGFRLICSPHRIDSSLTSAAVSCVCVRVCVCAGLTVCLGAFSAVGPTMAYCWYAAGVLSLSQSRCRRRRHRHSHSLLSREPTAICFVFVLLLLLLLHFLVYVLYSNVGYSAKCWRARERVWESATNRKREHICSKEGLLQRECAMLCCFWCFCTCAFAAASFCYCCAAISAASMYFFTSLLCAQW